MSPVAPRSEVPGPDGLPPHASTPAASPSAASPSAASPSAASPSAASPSAASPSAASLGHVAPASAAAPGHVAPAAEPPAVPAAANLDGALDAVGADGVVAGWARDRDDVRRRLEVEILVDGGVAARGLADLFRDDLFALGWSDCAFRIALPQRFHDGAAHAVEVRLAATGAVLRGGPLAVSLAPPAPPPDAPPAPQADALGGHLDAIEADGWAAGWARGAQNPVRLVFLVDGEAVGSIVADQFRADLRDAGLGDSAFWFRIPKIFQDGIEHSFDVRAAETGETLRGAPRLFTLASPAQLARGSSNRFPNWALRHWPAGLVVAPIERFEEVADGWYFDRRKRTAPEIVFSADRPAGLSLPAGAYAMRIEAITPADGVRLIVPLGILAGERHRLRLSFGLRRPPGATSAELHLFDVSLCSVGNDVAEKVATVRKAVRTQGTVRLVNLPLDPRPDDGTMDPGTPLAVAFAFAGAGEMLLFSPQLDAFTPPPAVVQDPPGAFEDAAIAAQVPHLKLSPIWSGPAFAPALAAARRARPFAAVPFIQIVVPVHNAAADLETLLASIERATPSPYEVLLLDDASAPFTQARAKTAAGRDPRIRLLRHDDNLGYTRNINFGLQAAVSEFVVLINSDTAVTPGWLTALHAVIAADAATAAVGPLSNAASWQSIPRTKTAAGEWLVNAFAAGVTADDVAAILAGIDDGTAPAFPLLNGFCTLYRRAALEEVGWFDDATFPKGYGEENDLAIRLRRAGWILRVAPAVYVQHAKSRSFGPAQRKELSRAANRILRQKHPEVSFAALEGEMAADPTLARIRRHLLAVLRDEQVTSGPADGPAEEPAEPAAGPAAAEPAR